MLHMMRMLCVLRVLSIMRMLVMLLRMLILRMLWQVAETGSVAHLGLDSMEHAVVVAGRVAHRRREWWLLLILRMWVLLVLFLLVMLGYLAVLLPGPALALSRAGEQLDALVHVLTRFGAQVPWIMIQHVVNGLLSRVLSVVGNSVNKRCPRQ